MTVEGHGALRWRSGCILNIAVKKQTLLVGLLAVAFLIQSFTASLVKSQNFDEVTHLAAGLSYLETGRIVVNQQHPPLLKEVAGIFLRLAGVRWPNSREAAALANGNLSLTNQVSVAIVTDNGPDKVMFWSRLPFILLATAGALVLYLLGKALVGRAAALGAVFLYCLDPNILGHSFPVATDVGVAVFVMVFLLALWNYLRRPSRVRILWCGLALGAALGAKFSAVMLLPVACVLALAGAYWPVEPDAGREAIKPPSNRKAPCPCGSGKKYKNCHGASGHAVPSAVGTAGRLVRYGLATAGMCAIAFAVIQLVYVFPKDPLQYLAGLRLVNADHAPGYLVYMAGQLAPRFYSYYLVAYLVKEPVAAILLTALGLVFLTRNKSVPRLARIFLLVPPIAFFVGYTLFSDNIGIRYIIPVLPFAHMLGGVALAALIRGAQAWKRGVAVALSLWLVVAAVGIYPDHQSYFNEAACLADDPAHIGLDGGSRCGVAWLDDSNVDWGQGMKQLKAWLDRNAAGRTVRLGYLGIFPPVTYGIKHELFEDEDFLNGERPGLYAVSAHIVASGQARARITNGSGAEWLRRTPPAAIVGHAFYVYDIPERKPDRLKDGAP